MKIKCNTIPPSGLDGIIHYNGIYKLIGCFNDMYTIVPDDGKKCSIPRKFFIPYDEKDEILAEMIAEYKEKKTIESNHALNLLKKSLDDTANHLLRNYREIGEVEIAEKLSKIIRESKQIANLEALMQ